MIQIKKQFNDILTQDVSQYLTKNSTKNILYKKPYVLDNLLSYKDKFFIKNPRLQKRRKLNYEFKLSNYLVSESRLQHRARKRKNFYINSIYNLNPYIKIARQKYALYTHKKKINKQNITYIPQGLKVIYTKQEEIAKLQPGLYEELIKDHKQEIDDFMRFEYSTVSRLLDYHLRLKKIKKTSSFFNFYFFKSKYKQFLTLPFNKLSLNNNINKLISSQYPLYLPLAENNYKKKLNSLNIFKKVIKNRIDKKHYLTLKQEKKIKNQSLYHQRKREILIQILIKALINWFQKKKVKLLNLHPKLQDQYNHFLKILNNPEIVHYLFNRFGDLFFAKKYSTRLKKKKRYLKMFHHKSKFIYSFKTTRLSKNRFARSIALSLLNISKDQSWGQNVWIPKLTNNK